VKEGLLGGMLIVSSRSPHRGAAAALHLSIRLEMLASAFS
jgi:hypothetical protein